MPCILMSFAHCILAGSLSCLEDLGGIMGMGFITSLVSLCTYGKPCLIMINTVINGFCIPMSYAHCILSWGCSCLEVCLGIKMVVSITSLAHLCTSECVRVGVEGIPNRSSVPQTRSTYHYLFHSCSSSYRSSAQSGLCVDHCAVDRWLTSGLHTSSRALPVAPVRGRALPFSSTWRPRLEGSKY